MHRKVFVPGMAIAGALVLAGTVLTLSAPDATPYKPAQVRLQQVDPTLTPPVGITPGSYRVSVEVWPGRYRSDGGTACYWELQDARGLVIDNDLQQGPAVIRIHRSDAVFMTEGCKPWVLK